MKAHVCQNHSDRVTKIRCYRCKSYICTDCILHMDRHYFCSKKCFWLNRWDEFWQNLSKRKLELLAGWNALLTLALIGAFLLIWRGAGHADSVENNGTEVSENQPFMLAAPLDSLKKISGDIFTENSTSSEYTLSLKVQRGWIINIWRNDWPVVSEIATKDSNRQFVVPLTYDVNDIRVGVWNNQQQLAMDRQFQVIYRSMMVETLNRSVARGNPVQRSVSLTFDGGSLNTGAAEILDILAENNIRTTIFLTGQFVEKYPDLVNRILEDGHEIANHTYNHPHLTQYDSLKKHITAPDVTREFLQQQLRRTDSLFFALTGQKMKPYWRAPFGEINPDIIKWAAEIGYMHIYWSRGLDTRDWISDPSTIGFQTPSEAYFKIIEKDNARSDLNGGIVLMHLGTERETEPMYSMLPGLIRDLKDRNFEIVGISKLLNP